MMTDVTDKTHQYARKDSFSLGCYAHTPCWNLPGDTSLHHSERLEPKDAEDHHRRVDGCQRVTHRHQQHIPHAVVVRRVVGTEGDQGAEGEAERVEDLRRCVQPDRRVEEFLQLQDVMD